MTQITAELLQRVFPNTPSSTLASVAEAINNHCPQNGINTAARLAAFIAEAGYESGGFLHLQENLNYSAQGLLRTFPSHFSAADAAFFAHKPEPIANRAYGGRFGNGPESSGDGWAYSGKGYFQITFKANYQACATSMGMNLTDLPAYLITHDGACRSACWYWNSRSLNSLADSLSINQISQKIQGGSTTNAPRAALFNKLLPLIRNVPTTADPAVATTEPAPPVNVVASTVGQMASQASSIFSRIKSLFSFGR
jgi:putative chitinase